MRTDREILAALVASLKGASVGFDNQFAVGLQVKGAARTAAVSRLQRDFQEALTAARLQVRPVVRDYKRAPDGHVLEGDED
jgi:hypothetical protein